MTKKIFFISKTSFVKNINIYPKFEQNNLFKVKQTEYSPARKLEDTNSLKQQ